MRLNKRIVFIAYYDRVCLSIRNLAAMLKERGHDVYLVFIKEDRIAEIPELATNNLQYQMLWKNKFVTVHGGIPPAFKDL